MGTVSEGPNQMVLASWKRVPNKEKLCCPGGQERQLYGSRRQTLASWSQERQVIQCSSVILRASALGNSQYDFHFSSFFDQRPPGSVPAVLLGFQPALALTPDSETAPPQGAQPLSPSELPSVSSASQGHSLTISILSASRREGWQLNHRKTSSPSGAGDKEGCINPRTLQKCSQCLGSSHSQS